MAEIPPECRTDIPHSARVWNYWLGNKDNYEVDRVAAHRAMRALPRIDFAVRATHAFQDAAVERLVSGGIRQIIEIGGGFPRFRPTHEIAQHIDPTARVVHVDRDPLALAHSRAMLVPQFPGGRVKVAAGDIHSPQGILTEAATILDLSEPVVALMVCVLGHAQTDDDLRRVVKVIVGNLPAGSEIVLCEATTNGISDPAIAAAHTKFWDEYSKMQGVQPYRPRPLAVLRQLIDGLDLVSPGLTPATDWLPDLPVEYLGPAAQVFYAAVATVVE